MKFIELDEGQLSNLTFVQGNTNIELFFALL